MRPATLSMTSAQLRATSVVDLDVDGLDHLLATGEARMMNGGLKVEPQGQIRANVDGAQ